MFQTNKLEMTHLSSLVELCQFRAERHPDKLAYQFLINGEEEGPKFTYRELEEKARSIAAVLQKMRKHGDRAILLYQPGLDFVAAFFGCLYVGVVAVPANTPNMNRHFGRLQAIAENAQATLILMQSKMLSKLETNLSQDSPMRKMRWLATDRIPSTQGENWQEQNLDRETLAFLQYTSGSTGTPKGVMVTHGNLLHNVSMIKEGYELDEQDVIVSWLPLFHDMGLIGNMLLSMYIGATCIMMSPVDFLQKPIRWLEAISRYRATYSGAPNFAYDLCIHKVTEEQKRQLDLSTWEVAFNGAEPVRQETLERFASVFAPCGFRKQAINPSYGLAEGTLMVSVGFKKELPVYITVNEEAIKQDIVEEVSSDSPEAKVLVGCGHTWSDQEVVIVHPETKERCPEDRIGEIWVKGSSIAKGYWNLPDETKNVFQAYIGDMGEGPYLRTGDLGFKKGNELFITGRLKDVIIIHGQNHYPQDIELTVEKSHEALRRSTSAAFSVTVDGEEKLVVVSEVWRHFWPVFNLDRENERGSKIKHRQPIDAQEIIEAVREAVACEHELQLYDFVMVKEKTIPKTSSGKIQRRATKENYLNGTLVRWGEQHG